MNIVLTQQDADFILKFIRTDLTVLQTNHNNTEQSYERLNKTLEKHKDFASTILYQSIKDTADTLMKESNRSNEKLIKELEKCIELLTVGSEVCSNWLSQFYSI